MDDGSGSVLQIEPTELPRVGGRKTCVWLWANSRVPLNVQVKMPKRQFDICGWKSREF